MNRTNRSAVAGIFPDRAQADTAIDALRSAGFSKNDVGIAVHGGRERETAYGGVWRGEEPEAKELPTGERESGFLGSLASFFGAGGSLIDALKSMGFSENDSRYYDREFRAGRTLVTVKCHDKCDDAFSILRSQGADVEPSTRLSGTDYEYDETARPGTATPPTRGPVTDRDRLAGEDERTMRLREEQLRARKEQVETGEVRIRKEVVTEHQQMNVPVSHEEVVIERHPVEGREARGNVGDIGEGEEIRIPVREERVHVEKEPVVREELTAEKRPVEETRRVEGEVRREEARIEREGDVNVTGPEGNLGTRGRRHEHHYVNGRCVDCDETQPTGYRGASGDVEPTDYRGASAADHDHDFVNGRCTICGKTERERMP